MSPSWIYSEKDHGVEWLTAIAHEENVAIFLCVAFIAILYSLLRGEIQDNKELTKNLSAFNVTSSNMLQLLQIIRDDIVRGPKK